MIATSSVSIINVDDGQAYALQPSNSVIIMEEDGDYKPSQLSFQSVKLKGTDNPSSYSGRFKIEKTSDETNWTTEYTSSSDESSITYNMPSTIEEKTPYIYRPTCNGDNVGSKAFDTIVGGTVVWNQLANFSVIPSALHGITYSSVDGKSVTFSGTANGAEDRTGWFGISETMFSTRVGHNVLILPKIISGSFENGTIKYSLFSGVTCDFSTPAIRKVGETQYTQRLLTRVTNGTVANDFTVTFICIDLNQMFGSTIADYIYSLEQATAGAGVAWFKKLFPKDYYEYNAGELLSVSGLQSHDMVGFNQCSSFTNSTSGTQYQNALYVEGQLLPNTTYCLSFIAAVGHKFYRNENLFVGNNFNITGDGTRQYVVVTTVSNLDKSKATQYAAGSGWRIFKNGVGNTVNPDFSDVCISPSSDRNGEYEPYVKHTYHLDSTLTLRGIPKLDAQNNLYYDGDEYLPDGTVKRRYKVVEFGSDRLFNGTFGATDNGYAVYVNSDLGSRALNAVCDRFVRDSNSYVTMPVMTFGGGSGAIVTWTFILPGTITNLTEANNWLIQNPFTMVIELETPITEIAEPYQQMQICDNSGTEEYVTTGIVPVGHITKYTQDISSIRCSLYASGGTTTLLDQQIIPVVNDAESAVYMTKQIEEYRLSDSSTSITGSGDGYDWADTMPTVPPGKYLWKRLKSYFSNGSIAYSDAVCDVVTSGLVFDVDRNTNAITSKVWESDITTKINQYDGSTGAAIRDRVSQTETNISGITTRVSDVETTTDGLETRMTTAESNITQNANNITTKVSKDGVISSINQSAEAIQISASKVDLIGNVTFSMLDSSTQNTVTKLTQNTEQIIGTQTSNTYAWTGVSHTISELYDGLSITYLLPRSVGGSQIAATYTTISSGATTNTNGAALNLTLKDGTATGNIPVWYMGVSRVTSHFGYGSSLRLVYHENLELAGSYRATGWWIDAQYNSDTVDNRIVYFTGKTGSVGIWGGSLFMRDSMGTYQNICTASDGTVTNASSGNGARTVATTKLANTHGFEVGSPIWYTTTSYNANSNISGTNVVYSSMGNVFDSRYAFNTTLTTNSLTPYANLYLVGTINSTDGLFYLDSIWWTQTATDTSKVYILVGGVYDSTTSYCRITLYEDNKWLVYKDGKLQEYNKVLANNAQSTANSATSLLGTWTGDATLATTTINGGYIKTHTIESTHLATNAIMSQNYSRIDTSSPYSSTGAFLDLETGTLYMPNFGVNGTTGASYFNGTVNANAGKFGDDSSYWNIETVYDYNMQPHAALVGTGSPYLQTGNWQVSDNAVATRKYTSTSESSGNATYYKDSGTNTFYDVGMKIPTNFAAYSASDSSVTRYNKAFYYGRKYTGNNAPSLDSDWTYFFSIDSGGNVITAGDVYEGGVKLSDKYAAITDVGSAYLPKTGGTITGNLSVNGSFTTNLQLQTNLGSTSSAQLTGAANAVVKPGVTGTLGVGNGGTGKSSWTANQIVYASASNTLSQLGSGTSGQILKSNGSSAPSWVNQSTLSVGSATKATQDGNGNVIVNTYMPIAGGQFTGAVYVPDEFSADSAQLGSLIVNGAARFTNDVFADTFTGNLVGTASNAVKVGNNLVIKLNGGSTEGTNLFTYNGSAAKTINITASSIGAQASGTYAGGISNGGAASKLAYQAGNEINFVSTADTQPTSVYFNYRNGYTGSKTGVSADYAYYFDNGNAEYNRTTLYAAQFSGNAATATTATTADKVGNNLVILFNSGSTEGTNKFTYNGSAAKNVNITKAGIGLENVENTALSTWAGSANLTTTKVGTLAAAAAKGVDASISASSTSVNLPTSEAVATFVEGKGYVTSSGVTSITLKAGTGVSLDTDNTAITSIGTRTISLANTYGDTKNPYGTKTKNYVLAGPSSGSAAVPTFRALVADDIPTITPAKAGLGNVTNDKQVKGLSSGTTSGHLVSWGANGYTVADSGIATTSVTTKIKLAGSDYSASSNVITITQANLQSAVQSTGLVLMTSAERSKLESIQVSEGGTIDFSGVTASSPLTATVGTNKTVNITHNTSGVSAGTYRSVTVNTYGHVTAGTNPTTLSGYGITDAKIASGVITLGSNTITPLTASSTLDATKLSGTASISTTGNATTATKFSSNRSITLTGDVVGTSSSNGENGWSLTTAIVDDSHNHTTETIVPLQTKTYTGIIASANDEAKGQLYFIKVQPDAYGGQWSIHYKVTATIDGVSAANGNGYETSDVYLSGMRDTYSGYRTWNDITNTSYRPYYYHCFYRAKEAGINGGYGHAIGINLRYSYNPTTAANTRTVTFEIIKTEGCTVTLLDAPLIYANWPGTGSTNYNTYNNFDATTQGNTMSGDRNDVNYYNRNYYGSRTAAADIYRYQLCLTKKDRSLLPINSVNNDVSTNKSLTTESFDPFGDILYWSSTTTYSAGANVGDGWYAQYLADIRYSFNIGGYNTTSTLVGRKPLYLVATPQADGTAVLHSSPLAQDLPTTEDGLIYIYLGQVYQDTHPYRLYLTILHPIYWYKNGAVRQYIQTSEKALQDGNGAVIASTYAKLSGATFTGAINTASSTWNTIGDDAYLGDINKAGHIGIKGKNGNTGLFFVTYNQNSNTTGGAITWDGAKFSISGTVDTSISGNAATAATASTATKWASAQTVYVALGTASKTTSIQGGSSSAVTLGVDGVLGVANGGTGASSFTANSVIMSGSTTTGAFTTRAVTNNTSASAVTANTNLITANTLAYWTGSSNLTTCKQGTFGAAATYSATTSVTSGSSALVTSGGVSSALGNYVTLSTAQTISGAKTFSAVTSITNTTASTSKSTGALNVSGGVGISGQMSANTVMIGDAVSLVYDSSISALCFQFD